MLTLKPAFAFVAWATTKVKLPVCPDRTVRDPSRVTVVAAACPPWQGVHPACDEPVCPPECAITDKGLTKKHKVKNESSLANLMRNLKELVDISWLNAVNGVFVTEARL